MTSFLIFLTGCVLSALFQVQGQFFASGSGANFTGGNATDSPPQLCLPLPSDHPCRNLTGRGSTHALPQVFPVDLHISDSFLEFAFAISRTIQTTDSQECLEIVEYHMCLLGAPPCDPVSHQPLLICDRNCEALNRLKADGACNNTVDILREIIISSEAEDVLRLPETYESFNCGNASTYYFFEVDTYEDTNTCTNLLSMESEEKVLNRIQCVAVGGQACAAIYPLPYYIPLEERLEGDTFIELTTITREVDRFCGSAFLILACSYLYPACNPERATQLAVCSNSCSLMQMVNEICYVQYKEIVMQIQMEPFVQYFWNFRCLNPQSYLIPGVPVDTQECISVHDLFEIHEEKSDNSPFVVRIVSGTLGSLGILLTILLVVIIIVCIYSRRNLRTIYYRQGVFSMARRNKPVLRKEIHEMEHQSRAGSTSTTDVENCECEDKEKEIKLSSADVQKYESLFSGFVFHCDNLEVKETIGEGAFGKVHFGILNDPDRDMMDVKVAIKTLKHIYSEKQLREFFAESLIMKDFHHPHIVGLLGVCFDTPGGFPYTILPFMANGSLKKYLKEKRAHVLDVDSYPKGLPLEMLTHMCIDIAEGMAYLAEHKFVHRDLAARNCMLNSEMSVLVGDFGLARDIYASAYYRAGEGAKLPVKWMPPETLHDGISNQKTDVWSYGVTCWEVFSLGRTPYPGIENHEILDHITNGERPKKPSLCPEKLYALFSQCWHYLPEERPSFEQILSSLKEYWDEEHFYMVQSFTQ